MVANVGIHVEPVIGLRRQKYTILPYNTNSLSGVYKVKHISFGEQNDLGLLCPNKSLSFSCSFRVNLAKDKTQCRHFLFGTKIELENLITVVLKFVLSSR